MIRYVIAFILSFVFSLYWTPLMRKAALQLGIVDRPDGKLKTHESATPYFGGVAVFIAFLLTVGHWALVQAAKFDPHLSQVYVRHIRYQNYYPARAPISAPSPRIRASVPTPKEMRA